MIIPKTRKIFAVGVDAGKPAETTAHAVVERRNPRGWTDPNDAPPDKAEFHVRDLRRHPPGTQYVEIASAVSALFGTKELSDDRELTPRKTIRTVDLSVDLVIDQTAIGEPVADMILDKIGRPAKRVVISGTHADDYSNGVYRVPKQSLIGGLEVLLETKRLLIAEALSQTRHLADELVNYRGRPTPTVPTSVDTWREQPSDDLVFAVALACWRLRQESFRYEFI
jgi:hypothetical protein